MILATDDTFLERSDNYGDRDGDGLTNKTDYPREGNYPAARTMSETVDRAARRARPRVLVLAHDAARTSSSAAVPAAVCRGPTITDGWTTPYKTSRRSRRRPTAGTTISTRSRPARSRSPTTINKVVLDSHCNPILL